MISDVHRAVQPISVCQGFTRWRRPIARSLLEALSSRAVFNGRAEDPLALAQRLGAGIVVWASEEPPGFAERCAARRIPLLRMEDGFIRSVGLGSDFSWPHSMVLDRGGIYFDPHSASDLEQILGDSTFDERMLERAARLRRRIVAERVTKYQVAGGQSGLDGLPAGRKLILVPGQVARDASVIRGGGGIKSNLELLAAVRRENPDAFIIYRPHPDVARGNRNGAIHADALRRFADRELSGGSIAPLLEVVHEVHTLTSLAGFEALLRGTAVHTYGGPFYAGWGLTQDRLRFPRRRRRLSIEALVAGTLIAYPVYFDWSRGAIQEPESALDQLTSRTLPLRLRFRSGVYFAARGVMKRIGLMDMLRRRSGKAGEIPTVERAVTEDE